MAAADNNEEDRAAAEWAPFTPSKVDARLCSARTWNGGRGGQCQQFPAPGSDLCGKHLKQDTESFLTYGRVDGHIPAAKLREFKRLSRMQSWGGNSKASSDSIKGSDPAPPPPRLKRQSTGSKPDVSTQEGPSLWGAGPGNAPKASSSSAGSGARPPLTGNWLSVDGFVLEKPPGGRAGSGRAWSYEEVWAQALPPERGPGIHVSVPGSGPDDEPWVSLAIATCKKTLERRGSGPLASADAEWTVTAEALWLLRRGVEQWVSQLLGELQELSRRRAGLDDLPASCSRAYDFSLQAQLLQEEAASQEEGAKLSEVDAQQQAEGDWQRALGMRQRFFRVGVADMRTWLLSLDRGQGLLRGTAAGPRLPPSARQSFLQAACAEMAAT